MVDFRADELKLTTSILEMNKFAHSLSRLAGDDAVRADNNGLFYPPAADKSVIILPSGYSHPIRIFVKPKNSENPFNPFHPCANIVGPVVDF